MCNGDYHRPIYIKLMDVTNQNNPQPITTLQTSLDDMITNFSKGNSRAMKSAITRKEDSCTKNHRPTQNLMTSSA